MNVATLCLVALTVTLGMMTLRQSSANAQTFVDDFDSYETGSFAPQARPGWTFTSPSGSDARIVGDADKRLIIDNPKRNEAGRNGEATLRHALDVPVTGPIAVSFALQGRVDKEVRLVDASGHATTFLRLNRYEPEFRNVADMVNQRTGKRTATFGYAGGGGGPVVQYTLLLDPSRERDNFVIAIEQPVGPTSRTDLLTGTFNFAGGFRGIEFAAEPVGGHPHNIVLNDYRVADATTVDLAAIRRQAMQLPYNSTAPETVTLESIARRSAETFQKLAADPHQLQLAQRVGVVDVTLPPYSADPTGTVDATNAIQQAIDDAREPCLVVYLPAGTYRVSKTIELPQPGASDLFVTDVPGSVLMGPKRATGGRAVLKLAPDAEGFGDPNDPRPVVHIYKHGTYNTNFRQQFLDIDIEIGPGNPGAIGITGTGAQWTTIEGVTVRAGDGFAGLYSISGAGGGVHDFTVIGGRYGIYTGPVEGSTVVPAMAALTMEGPGISHLTLIGQREAAIYSSTSRSVLSLTGVRIEGAGIVMETVGWRRGEDGRLTIVDGVIRYSGAGPAIRSNRSVYLSNVYVENAETIAEVQNTHTLKGNSAGWAHVAEYIGACTTAMEATPFWPSEPLQDVVMLDGEPAPAMLAQVQSSASEPPANIVSQHYWGDDFPAWYDADTVNVKDAPYNAKGDGKTDDWAAIQKAIDEHEKVLIPRGTFMISKPLRMKKDTKLIGTSLNATNVLPIMPGFQGPMIDTEDAADGTAVLAWMNLLVHSNADPNGPYAIRWRVGRDSMHRGMRYERRANFSERTDEMRSQQIANVLVEGGGGGRWWNPASLTSHNNPHGRHYLVRGTREPLALYQFNPEHGAANPYVEIDDCRNISIFAMKNEGGRIMHLRDSANIRVLSQSGNARSDRENPMFVIENCDDFVFANIDHEIHARFGEPFDLLVERHAGQTVTVDGRHLIGLYKRGEPSFEAPTR